MNLRKLLGLCEHHWKEDSREFVYFNQRTYEEGRYSYILVRLQCKVCGNFKKVKV